MKIIKLILLLLIFTSCEEYNYEPIHQEPNTPSNNHNHNQTCFTIWGDWELLDAKMYVTNIETGEEWVDNQFGYGDTIGSLRYYEPIHNIEILEKNKTVWGFRRPNSIPGISEFILNMDTLEVYGLNVTNSNYTVIEHPSTNNPNDLLLGGSARNITPIFNNHCKTLEILTQESYENINGYNHHYYTILKFRKV
jgi:hypothetical protein|tara:strand:+ start:69 stop:650 length:582 start_codon:yes stop_codon:yes gene_type:complete